MPIHQTLFPCILLLAMGCGGSTGPKIQLGPASGKAIFNNAPIKNATITFYPESGPVGVATTDDSGAFEVRTNGRLGAVVGKHKVTVSGAKEDNVIPPMNGKETTYMKKPTFDPKYSDPQKTTLVVTLEPSGDKDIALELTK
ncbi:carboxypeptidase-like regulatory domain-containing protein [Planctomicrobium sp. SH668]|uniref:carboxypeptidase-like regulatory domain-containing protein n=1 Tax=Planctomicrobium sp. SH668 TaxID=3448126 RepID=UPI003F5CB9EE